MKQLFILVMLFLLFVPSHDNFGNGDGEPEPEIFNDGWVYATIEYRDDLLEANKYFMEVKAHPQAKFPKITGGYAETNVHVNIRLRGVSVPRAMQTPGSRARPHEYVKRERARFDEAMDYVWSLAKLNKNFRLHNPKVYKKDEVVECDIEFDLGKQWISLAHVMIYDEHARPPREDDEVWDWGSKNVGVVHPSIPLFMK